MTGPTAIPPRPDGAGVAQPDVRKIAGDLRARWLDGEVPDTIAALTQFPCLREHRVYVLELAYEEFCLRIAAGLPLIRRSFARNSAATGIQC